MYEDLFALRHELCVVALTALAVVVILHHQGVLRRTVTAWLLAGLCAFGLWQYPVFGSLNGGRLLHANEFTHYYFGGKYFKELDYRGFYIGIAIGLQDAGVRIDRIRNLENKSGYLSRDEFLPQADSIRARFTPERWAEFVSDLNALRRKVPGFSYDDALLDAGFNGTPTWVLFSRLLTWIPPAHAYFITSADALLIAAAVCLLGATFGWTQALMALALFLFFPSGSFGTFDWTGGSVLRMLWVFWLSLALVLYKRNQPFWAGCAFALATMERLFPGAFAAAAVVVSAVQARNATRGHRAATSAPWRFVVLLVAGGTVTAALGLIVTQLMWPGSWGSFASDIAEHSHYLFSNHFGWSRVAAFYPQQGEIAFSNQTPQLFADWSALMLERTRWPFFVISAFLVGGAIWVFSPSRLPPENAICLMGFSLIFLASLPAHYYLVMLLPIGVTFTGKTVPLPSVIAFWFLWVLCSVVTILPENLGWGLASLLMMAFLSWQAVFLALDAKHSAAFRAAAAVLSTAALFALHIGIVSPRDGGTPPAIAVEATPVRLGYSRTVTVVTRNFPDPSAHIVRDTGGIITSGDYATFVNPLANVSLTCRVIVRTDRFFTGTLELWASQARLHSWPVDGRGWIFDYITATAPCLPQYWLRWTGPNNIALFQTWIEPVATPVLDPHDAAPR